MPAAAYASHVHNALLRLRPGFLALALLLATLTQPATASAAAVTEADCTIFAVADQDTEGTDAADVICGTPGDDHIHGGLGNDVIFAGAGDDLIYSEGGDDVVNAGAGDDVVYGGDGDDVLRGDSDRDYLYGQVGRDYLFISPDGGFADGGIDDDYIYGGLSADVIRGNAGDDYVDASAEADDIDAGAGDDYVLAGDGADRVFGGAGSDVLKGGAGNDGLDGGAADDVVDGGAGTNLCNPEKIDTFQNCKQSNTAPAFGSVNLSVVTSSDAGKVVRLSVVLTDPAAGTRLVKAKLQRVTSTGFATPVFEGSWVPSTSTYCLGHSAPTPSAGTVATTCLVNGNGNSANYEFDFWVPANSPKATYRLTSLIATDTAGKTLTLGSAELKSKGFAVEFKHAASDDSVAPSVSSVTTTPDSLDSSTGTAVVSAELEIVETQSGVASAVLTYQRRTGSGYAPLKLELAWQLADNSCNAGQATSPSQAKPTTGCLSPGGTLQLKKLLPATLPKGPWFATSLQVTDVAGNTASLDADALALSGSDAGFEQTGTPASSGGGGTGGGDTDKVAPLPIKAVVIGNNFDTSSAPQVVTLQVRTTDEGSGLIRLALVISKQTSAGWGEPSTKLLWTATNQQCENGVAATPTAQQPLTACLISPDNKNGVVEFKIFKAQKSAKGVFQITRMELKDAAANTRAWTVKVLEEKLLAKRFKIVG